jgi:hypothetical protein
MSGTYVSCACAVMALGQLGFGGIMAQVWAGFRHSQSNFQATARRPEPVVLDPQSLEESSLTTLSSLVRHGQQEMQVCATSGH